MAVIDWKKAINGDYSTAKDWLGGVIPSGGGDDAILETLAAGPYVVTSDADETIGFLEVDASNQLVIGNDTTFSIQSSGTSSAAYNYGTISVEAGSTLEVGVATTGDNGGLAGPGAITVVGTTAHAATLELEAPFVTLKDGQHLALSGNASVVTPNDDAVSFEVKDARITGSGTIGDGSAADADDGLTLIVSNQGAIVANGGVGLGLTLNTGANAIQNAGVIEAVGAGGLTIDSQVYENGVLAALGVGALTITNDAFVGGLGNVRTSSTGTITLNEGQLSIGGLITIGSAAAPGGTLKTTTGNTVGLSSTTDTTNIGGGNADVVTADIDNYGNIDVADNSTLNLSSTVFNLAGGAVRLQGSTGPTDLEIYNGGSTIWGGAVILSDSEDNNIVADGAGEQISNFSTIRGAGTIGDGNLRLYNGVGGVVNANQSNNSLTIVADATAVTASTESNNYNAGVVEATGAGGLVIDGAFGNGGYLVASGAGVVTLDGEGLSTDPGIYSGGGVVETVGKGSIVLEDDAEIVNQAYLAVSAAGKVSTSATDTGDVIEDNVINHGAVDVVGNSTLIVDGHWQNYGTVDFQSTSTASTIEIATGKSWTLLDGGTLVLNNGDDKILSQGAGTAFRNRGNLVEGTGTIGDGNMTIENDYGSTIEALDGTLTLNATPYDAATSTTYINNAGVLEAGVGGMLTLDSAAFSSGDLIANSGGTVVADDAIYGPGLSIIRGDGTVEFNALSDNDVRFAAGADGTLALGGGATLNGDVYGLAIGDSIDFTGLAYNATTPSANVLSANASFGKLDGELQVTNGTTNSVAVFLEGNYTSAYLTAHHLTWEIKQDAGTGTLVTLAKAP